MTSEQQVDVYPVGLLLDWKSGRFRNGLRYLARALRAREWRSARNEFNGYLAEHDGHPHNCGKGWTKRAAVRRAAKICAEAAALSPAASSADGGEG